MNPYAEERMRAEVRASRTVWCPYCSYLSEEEEPQQTRGETVAGRVWLAVAIVALLVLLGMGLAVS